MLLRLSFIDVTRVTVANVDSLTQIGTEGIKMDIFFCSSQCAERLDAKPSSFLHTTIDSNRESLHQRG